MSETPGPAPTPEVAYTPPAPRPRRSRFEKLRPDWHDPRWRVAAAVLVAGLVLTLVAWQRCGLGGCPDVRSLTAYQPGGAPTLLDREGRKLGDLAPVEGDLIRLGTLPKFVSGAFVAVEDRRFREHGGVDWPRVFGAVVANVRAGEVDEGFSTISMQLARNVFPDRLPGQQRTLRRKLLEIRVAREIEDTFTKDEILELYLNHIYFGHGARGIEAAARHYFGKPAARLTLPEAALLAGLPKAPSHYDPRRHPKKSKERRDLVLTMMEEQKVVTPAEAAEARKAPVRVVGRGRPRQEAGVAAYFEDEVRRQLDEVFGEDLYRRPMKVHTTLDANLQKVAEQELERQLAAIEAGALGPYSGPRYAAGMGDEEGTPYLQGAFVALDAKTGDVLAWVGGRDFQQSRFDHVRAGRRQLGSVFKPFVYAAALQAGHPMSEHVSDEPITIPLGGRRQWTPKNFDGAYAPRVSLRDALVNSKNVATIRVAQSVGTSTVATIASTFGLPGPIPEEPSMPLGTLSASPLDVAAAFTPFANLGPRSEPRAILKVEAAEGGEVLHETPIQSRPVLDPAVAYVIDDVLQDALNRGTGTAVRASGYRGVAAGKTGTTNDGADAWFVGWTPDVVAVVWIGFDKPQQILRKATGGRVAAPVWARVMSQYYRGRTPKPWGNPGGVTAALVDPATGFVLDPSCGYGGPTYKELFVGMAPNPVCPQVLDPMLYAGGLPPGYVMGADGVVIGPDGQPIDTESGFDPEFASGDAAWPRPPQPPGDGEESGMVSYTPSDRAAPPDTRPAANGDTRVVPTAPQEPLNPSPEIVGRPAASPRPFEESARPPRAQPSVEAVPLGGHPPEEEDEDDDPPEEEPTPEPPNR